MHLVAVYLKDNYLYNKNQVINFGGRYTYFLNNKNIITRKLNDKYIDKFYAKTTIQQISAIVGKNGSGKTSLLHEVIEIIQNKRRFASESHVCIFENDMSTFCFAGTDIQHFDFKIDSIALKLETIYYSPFLDYKSPLPGIDIGFDTILENDLEKIYSINDQRNYPNPFRHLKMANWLRQIEFQNSEFRHSIAKLFDFPEFETNKITFTRHKIDVDKGEIQFHNTPYGFRKALQNIFNINKSESSVKNRPHFKNHADYQKHLLKNYIVLDILCLLIKQMEKINDFLSEGYIPKEIDSLIQENKFEHSKDALLLFLKNHYYKYTKESEEFQILPDKDVEDLINEIFEMIDSLEAKNDKDTRFFDWSDKSIILNKEQSKRLLQLNNNFLIKVDQYYELNNSRDEKPIFSRTERIEGFLNFEPSNRSLSSGENALLNFYSRIYGYFHKNLLELERIEKAGLYILFLDEADLGFHPQWKKLFVKSCITFITDFFKKLDVEVQIILTTHDPLTLSDILNYNIIYLTQTGSNRKILNESEEPLNSFGANIHDLLAHSFFLNDGFMGEFAKEKINSLIKYIENGKLKDKDWNKEKAKKFINLIGEPLIRNDLEALYFEVFYDENEIDLRIEDLKKIKDSKRKK